MDRTLATNLRIAFPPPGFFLFEARLTLLFDSTIVYAGSFRQGVDFMLPVTAGTHVLSTRIELDAFTRSRDYVLDLPSGQLSSVLLKYSRFWGNFTQRPELTLHR